MKEYELYSNIKTPKNMNIVLRIDGRNFHNLSKNLNLKKPYDSKFSKLMRDICLDLYNEFSPLFIYTFSDEISILLSNIPFSSRIEKLNSVFASYTSSSFMLNQKKYFNYDKLVSFDSRIIPLVNEDVFKYFKWRQDEAWRNCINAYGIWMLNKLYSKKEANGKFKGLNSNDIHDLLFNNGINLNDLPVWQKRGLGVYENKIDCNLDLFNEKFFTNILKNNG